MTPFLIPTQGPEDWQRQLADPENHWRSGFSAKAFAYCWQSAAGFPPEVLSAFSDSEYELFHGIEMLFGIPELKVPLPGGRRASQTDLFVLAKSRGELVSIAVEGKVSESFDSPISEWLVRGLARSEESAQGVELGDTAGPAAPAVPEPSAGKRERLAYLCQVLDLAEDAVQETPYQLVHRTVSALIEAEVFNAPHAFMLVHSFSQMHERFEDFRAFGELLGAEVQPGRIARVGTRAGIGLYLGWVTGHSRWLEV